MFTCCLLAVENRTGQMSSFYLHVRFLSRVIIFSLIVLPRLPPPAVLLKKYKGSVPLHTFQMHSQDKLSSRILPFEQSKKKTSDYSKHS